MHLSSRFRLFICAAAAVAVPTLAAGTNDFACTSTTHPNPVVLLHGLLANAEDSWTPFQQYLQDRGYCSFATTYGASDILPFIGGPKPIEDSAKEIAAYIREVKEKTGAKIDLVGHSEGGFQSLYVPKFEEGISEMVDKIVAMAPPTNGTDNFGIYDLTFILGDTSRELFGDVLDTVGCDACNDLIIGGPAVEQLNDGTPIVQPGNVMTVIATHFDEIVTPPEVAFVHEHGVTNEWVQDTCPQDSVGHISLIFDQNVWNLVTNALESTPDREFTCVTDLLII
ncbi:alpha/beta-hydrolase [Aspergillus ellipticus CBS 707.79]|uniref:Alpha/beta-hydrolase n=1 Tax=Aspergillus ellipticus CBS 707.79 TaxID=1448320 RepID=A0A319EZS1_9EURO|nr:alpha/beta-hydrolase [Aspergillus ellipticus CBS 707.79]